ncbi:MAG: hypothetical protein HYX24_05815 [Candidatus Aenigmarchaeota archaeon]|nr:hypothetical protein [Candidatus Aenigmarchaeota archaeon]
MNVHLVFGLVFAAIVLFLILFFGMQQIKGLFCFGQEAKLSKAVDDITRLSYETYQLAEGSSRLYRVDISRSDRICFVSPSKPYPRDWPKDEFDWKPESIVYEKMISDMSSQYYQSNMWVYSGCKGGVGQGYKAVSVVPKARFGGDSGNFCSSGGHTLFFENRGTEVEVSVKE